MAKISYARYERARALLERVQRGPAFLLDDPDTLFSGPCPQSLDERYKLWVGTWVLPELLSLVPELRRKG